MKIDAETGHIEVRKVSIEESLFVGGRDFVNATNYLQERTEKLLEEQEVIKERLAVSNSLDSFYPEKEITDRERLDFLDRECIRIEVSSGYFYNDGLVSIRDAIDAEILNTKGE